MVRRPSRIWIAGAVVVGLKGSGAALGAGEVARGEVAFQKCYACHSVVRGETGLAGPNLLGVVGRPVASIEGFDYSAALEALPERGIERWDETALDLFLESPDDVAPGTDMTFVGLRDPAERADVIAYLLAQARPE